MHFIIGTAGHIDHGKSTIVKAITGIDPDRLKEEKERGITIDIGFANYKTKEGDTIFFIDVPGHEKFIRNMIAGAVGIDAVLLVIAANEGIKPQTIEHLQICELLGIRRGIVALSKIDLIDEKKIPDLQAEIKSFLKGSFLDNSPIIPVSAENFKSIDNLKIEIEKLKDFIIGKPKEKLLRIPIDRVFIMKGFGLIITGVIFEGIVRKNQSLEIFPKGLQTKAKNIQVHKEDRQEAYAGERVAINLAYLDKEELNRGDIVGLPNSFLISNLVEAKLNVFKNYIEEFKKQTLFRFFHGTSESQCLIRKIYDINQYEFLCQIELLSPTVILPGDKFIIRTLSPMLTIGGGYVLDISKDKIKKKYIPIVKEKLEKFINLDLWDKVIYWIEEAGEEGLSISYLSKKTGYAKEIILENLKERIEIFPIEFSKEYLISRNGLSVLKNKIEKCIKDFQENNPLGAGMQKSLLKSQYFPNINSEIFQVAIKELINEGRISSDREYWKINSFVYELKEEEKKIIDKILKAYNEKCFTPPSWEEIKTKIGNGSKLDKILYFLLNRGELIRISSDLIYNKRTIEEIKNKLIKFLKDKSEITISEFKEMVGVSRKYAIPLLEYFDKIGITLRFKDRRRLRE